MLGLYWGLGFRDYILGLHWENGKENGNYRSMLGLYRDNGKKTETTM